jgi:predicted NBD/HSP70 family sugar kinase
MTETVVGVDLGASNVRAHFYAADDDGESVSLRDLVPPTRCALRGSVEAFREAIVAIALAAGRWQRERGVAGQPVPVGVAPPGPMNVAEGWVHPNNLDWGRFYLRDRVAVWVDCALSGDVSRLESRDAVAAALSRALNEAGFRHPYDGAPRDLLSRVGETCGTTTTEVRDVLNAMRQQVCRFDNDVNTQAFWLANQPAFRRFRTCFVGNPGTGYGGGLTLRDDTDALALPCEAVEVGMLNDFGCLYRLPDDETFDGRPAFERLWRESRVAPREYDVCHNVEAFVSGPGLVRVLFGILGASEREYAEVVGAPEAERGALIAERAVGGDALARRALELFGFHLGASFYRVDCLENPDAILWSGNTAEKDASLMERAVIEGYAANCPDLASGRERIGRKLHVICADDDAEHPYRNVGAKGAALSVTGRGRRATARMPRAATRLVVDCWTLSAGYVDAANPHSPFRPVSVTGFPFAGSDAEERAFLDARHAHTYGDAFRAGDARLRHRVLGYAIADLMAWFFPDDAREVVLLGLEDAAAMRVLWDACVEGNEFGRPGMQFDKVTWVDARGAELRLPSHEFAVSRFSP